MQVPKGMWSPEEGRNKTEIVPFHLQGDITPFQLYCLSTHFWRSLLGQSAGHKRDGAVSRHSLLFDISGTQNSCASLSCYGISPKLCYPAHRAAKQLQSSFKTEATDPETSHTASSSKADCSSHRQNKFGPICKKIRHSKRNIWFHQIFSAPTRNIPNSCYQLNPKE